jgi:hypothetical protein
MNLKLTKEGEVAASVGSTLKNACLASCQTILARITAAKEAIFADSFKTLGTRKRLLRLALNEAEAVAWDTNYPHLVFPLLATEKIQAVVAWDAQQRSVRRSIPIYGLAV